MCKQENVQNFQGVDLWIVTPCSNHTSLLHCVTTKQTTAWIFIAVKTSNLEHGEVSWKTTIWKKVTEMD